MRRHSLSAQHSGDFQRLRAQHCRLVGETDAFEVPIRIEVLRHRWLEAANELLPVAAATNVHGNDVRFVLVANDEVVSAGGQCRA